MKEKPDLADQFIINHLETAYGMEISSIEFLPIGDISSAKYMVHTHEPAGYFLKLRIGDFKEISVTLPHYLHEHGISQVISPLKAKNGRQWTQLEYFTGILYPFISGQNGFQKPLSDRQWAELGGALKHIHSIKLPPGLRREIPADTYSSGWREKVRHYLELAEQFSFDEPVAAKMAADLQQHKDEIRFVVERAGELGEILQSQILEQVLCHSDIHAGNLLLEANGALHIIDWDDPILAPKERDLMFIGGGIAGIWNSKREEALFYQGYGGVKINLTALTYYRYERIVTDMAEFCQHILSTTEGGADRERSLQKFNSIFLPGQLLEIAHQADEVLKGK
jgi:spectinomycin phosphotransferase